MSFFEKFEKCLGNEPENHILPFFWQHGEEDEVILEELHRIYDSGVGALCVESRPHEGFAKEPWWEDMTLILEESKKQGLEVWVLDDKYFPTGFCNGIVRTKYPHLGKRGITERHLDVRGPVTDGAVILEGWADEDDTFLGAVAVRRGDRDQELTSEAIDITDRVSDGLVSVDLPEGVWRIFFIFERPVKDGRVDFTNPESVDLMFEEIYEPHYARLGKYFGSTFKGFFSDEPFLMDHGDLPIRGGTKSKGVYPWNKYIKEDLISRYGEKWFIHIPSLWFTMDGVTPKYRVDYMDTLTLLYKKHFCDRVGAWCRERGVDYIGHVVEDYGQHLNTGSGGHYFRALDGQSMAGIDVVLCQIVPGMTDHANSCPCWYDIADPDFFHFGLGKLAASHAHIQPSKKGRAMCEIFGAYGWAEGLKMMKWLADHMLVRGLNYFVPHAFSAKMPDEVPPQFSGAGHNPQFRYFRQLMEYMNRVSTVTSDGRHVSDAAILYHAEAEWSGGEFTEFEKPARRLTENLIDYDIIPSDYLMDAEAEDGKLTLNGNSYNCFIVPCSEYLPERVVGKLKELAGAGVDVAFTDRVTEKTVEGGAADFASDHIIAVPLDEIARWMREKGYFDLSSVKDERFLRFCHYVSGGADVYMLTNEAIDRTIDTTLRFSVFKGGEYTLYRPYENTAEKCDSADGGIHIKLEPYGSVMLIFGTVDGSVKPAKSHKFAKETEIGPGCLFSVCTAEEYPAFRDQRRLEKFINVTSNKENPRFGGFMRYEFTFDADVTDGREYKLDLGYAGESAEVELNGENCGARIIPPYAFDVTGKLKDRNNRLVVTVANHLGYEQRDLCSKYLLMEPSGLLGPVKLIEFE